MRESKKGSSLVDSIRNDIHTLDSKIMLIATKLRTMEKNEEVIGRTIVSHNNKLKQIDEKAAEGGVKVQAGSSKEETEQIKKDLKEAQKQVNEMKKKADKLSGEVMEMRYVLDSVNPLEYVTVSMVKDIVNDAIDNAGIKKGTAEKKDKKGGKEGLMEKM